ncbi:MAG: type II secretion system GspH family protein [Gammaproteobacteria bacterium]|nr:type II secretion system GspH family protein [Gammaproteobacteria bacterium]MBU1777350.1 type II secretion system GspH family protein [Gammaproteobacteria bacterium]MBU1968481.1 type II secretion system GspH family protein [Gammaproteobacteria bacterium]
MTKHSKHYFAQNGFSLVEMAIVLTIVALLMAGLLPSLSGQVEQQRRNETRKQLSEIRDALIGYALINGRLPCPADPTLITGQAGAGAERATCTTSANATGVVPWAKLGTSEIDGWGNRFTYRVTTSFADTTDGTGVGTCAVTTGMSFQLCSPGNLTVKSASAGTNVAVDIPAVIISHGKNGAGAYTQQGTQLAAGSADEVENSDGSADSIYVSHIPTSDYDDLTEWVTPNILFSRMVSAGKLP